MTTKFTKEKLLSLNPCTDGLLFAKENNFDFTVIYDKCERGDWLIWLLRKSGNMDKPQVVAVAIACAEHVLETFEKKYPDDKRPRKAIDAAKAWLQDPTEENRSNAFDAHAAAYAAAHAAARVAAAYATTYTAAYAAYAAYAAAYTAAYAARPANADAYTAAADVAAVDAAADAYAERKWQADKIRELIPNPFK
jgi:hypothetical protein